METTSVVGRLAADVLRYETSLQRVVAETQGVVAANERLEADVREAKGLLDGQPDNVIIDTVTLYDLSKGELFQAHVKLLQRWKLEKRRLEDLKLRIQQRQNELIQSNKATIKLFEVEQANVNQVAFQQSLAGNVAAMKWFKPAVKRQEAAIAALESLYDLALSKKETGVSVVTGEATPLFQLLEKENSQLRKMLSGEIPLVATPALITTTTHTQQQQQQRSILKKPAPENAQPLALTPSSSTVTSRADEKAANGDARSVIARLEREIAQLEKQVMALASEQAEEIATLEMKLLELDLQLNDEDTMSLASLPFSTTGLFSGST